MTPHELQPNLHFLAVDVESGTKTPLSHSTQFDIPSITIECGQVGCVHELQPVNFGISG